jgi:glycerophosphoryl diester phosphodiesterase
MRKLTRFSLGAGCAILLLREVLGAAAFPFFEPIQPPRSSEVMAHRGTASQAPENTRPALLRCIEDGFEWAEVDVRLTKDGHHVLCHDDHLSAGTSESWVISEHTLAQLKELDCGEAFAVKYSDERILTLPESLALAKGKLNLYLDCKAIDPKQLVRDILDSGMERQVVVYDSTDRLRQVQELAQGRVALMTKWQPGVALQPWLSSNHLAAVEINADQVTPEIVHEFHSEGIKVEVKVLGQWDRPEFWDRGLEAGADWFQSDLPEEVLAHALWQRVRNRPVQFSLHRGANRYAPENTLPAFAKAIRLGADYVEFDVRTTSDDKFYLLHDRLLDGKTTGRGPISDTPSSVIDTLSAGAKFGRPFAEVRLPTLDQFLRSVEGQVNLYFDAKAISPEALSEAVQRHHMAQRTVVYQSVAYLLRLKAIAPEIRALPPLSSPSQLEEIAEKLVPYGVDAKWSILSENLIERCHALGIRVFSDALGEHERIEDYQRAMDWKIDVIQTDHPLRLMRAIELRSRSAADASR